MPEPQSPHVYMRRVLRRPKTLVAQSDIEQGRKSLRYRVPPKAGGRGCARVVSAGGSDIARCQWLVILAACYCMNKDRGLNMCLMKQRMLLDMYACSYTVKFQESGDGSVRYDKTIHPNPVQHNRSRQTGGQVYSIDSL